MAQIQGIFVPIRADIQQLRSDMGQARQIITQSANSMTNALNGALTGDQLTRGVRGLVSNLSTLSQASRNIGQDFTRLGVNLGQFQNVTGTSAAQFARLQSQLLQTQAARAQERALADIARQAGLTQREIRALGAQFGMSQSQINNVTRSTTQAGSAFGGLLGYITPAVAGMIAFQRVASGVASEFMFGLKAVEDFGMGIAQSTALLTTFSQKAKDGDIGGAYLEANKYAKELYQSLEMIDQKTIANSKDLQVMSDTFIASGVRLDINNKKQIEGFTSVANALAIMTQGQNKDVQMRQEIRGLLDGEIRSQDKLGMLLKAQIPDIEKQLKIWQQEGTVLENLGDLLKGFGATTVLLEDQWATVGSTMETIHTRVLRGMFEPIFKDLIEMAKAFNKSMMDAEGNLTPLARGLIAMFTDAYAASKSFFDSNEKGWTMMIAKATLWGQQFNLAAKGFEAVKGLISDYGSTVAESTDQQITDLEGKLKNLTEGNKEWYQFSLFKDPQEDLRYADELKGKINELKQTLVSTKDSENEFMREKVRAIGGSAVAPTLAKPASDPTKSKASDMNAAMQAQVEALKAGEERKLSLIKASNELELQENQNAYDVGLKSYSQYLAEKNSITEESLQATLDARQKELVAAEEALASIKPVTDKEGNLRPDKDSKSRADAEKKVEDAKRAVIEAEKELQKAESEGIQQALTGAEERKNAYKEIQIQLLDSQGKTIEAARLQAEYDEESVERKRLMAEVVAGTAGAQEALDAQRLMSANRIKEAELESLSRQKDAQLALAEMDGEYYTSLAIQQQVLDIKIKNAELNGALEEEVELYRRQREELERMKSPLSAFAKGWEDVIKHQKTSSELMEDLAKETATSIRETFSDTFVMGMKGDFDDLGDLWDNLLDGMLDSFLKMIADMIVAWASTEFLQWITGTGDGDYFSYFNTSAKGNGSGSSSGSSATGTVGSLATTAVTSYAKEQIMTEVVTPAYEAAVGYFTGSGAAGATGAATASSGSVASGTATPAIMDAYATYGTTTAASTTATTTAAGTTGSTAVAAGGSETAAASGSSAGLLGMSAGQAGVVGAIIGMAIMIGTSHNKDIKGQMNAQNIDPNDLIASGLGGKNGTMATVQSDIAKLNDQLLDLDHASVSAADGIMIGNQAFVNAETGITESVGWMMTSFDAASGKWTTTTDVFNEMVAQMQEINPTTEQAVQATAQYVAEIHGIPSAADELVSAFGMMTSGILDFVSESSSAVADLVAAGASYYVNAMGEAVITAGPDSSSPTWTSNPVVASFEEDWVGRADGGWIGQHGSGWIHQGSGVKDDVFLGYSDGGRTRNFGMGGEFVTRKDRAAEWASELEYINTHRKLDFTPPPRNSEPAMSVGAMQQSAPDRIVVNIHGKGIEAIIDKVIVTRERQGVSGRAYI